MSSAAYRRDLGPHEAISYVKEIKALNDLDKLWLQELSEGKGFKELSGNFHVAARKNRFRRIRKFMGCINTTQAVAEAIRRGIIK